MSADDRERRNYFRVLCALPVRAEPISAERWQTLAEAILERRAPETQRIDRALAAWLERIERKLDRLLLQLGVGDPVLLDDADVQEVVLSGSGIRLRVPGEPAPDSGLLLHLELPGPPAHPVRCLARVVGAQPPKPGERGAITVARFEVIHESDREAVIKHTVEVQRTLLRARASRESERP